MDWTIRLGDVLTVVGFLFGGIGVILVMKLDINKIALKLQFLGEVVQTGAKTRDESLASVKQDVKDLGKEIDKLGQVVVLMGRFEERFLALQREVQELRHGRGFIKESN